MCTKTQSALVVGEFWVVIPGVLEICLITSLSMRDSNNAELLVPDDFQ